MKSQQEKYQEAVLRNVTYFNNRFKLPTKNNPYKRTKRENELSPTSKEALLKLNKLKRSIGIKESDSSFDVDLLKKICNSNFKRGSLEF